MTRLRSARDPPPPGPHRIYRPALGGGWWTWCDGRPGWVPAAPSPGHCPCGSVATGRPQIWCDDCRTAVLRDRTPPSPRALELARRTAEYSKR